MGGTQKIIGIRNSSNGMKLLFSVFKAGDNGVPYEAKWLEAGKSDTLQTGDFASVGVGVQDSTGGVWLGFDPAYGPTLVPASPGGAIQMFVFNMTLTWDVV